VTVTLVIVNRLTFSMDVRHFLY